MHSEKIRRIYEKQYNLEGKVQEKKEGEKTQKEKEKEKNTLKKKEKKKRGWVGGVGRLSTEKEADRVMSRKLGVCKGGEAMAAHLQSCSR